MAREAGGVWRLHSSLVAVTPHLARHAARRVRALRPSASGRFEFLRRNHSTDPLGRQVFDLYVRYQINEREADHG